MGWNPRPHPSRMPAMKWGWLIGLCPPLGIIVNKISQNHEQNESLAKYRKNKREYLKPKELSEYFEESLERERYGIKHYKVYFKDRTFQEYQGYNEGEIKEVISKTRSLKDIDLILRVARCIHKVDRQDNQQ